MRDLRFPFSAVVGHDDLKLALLLSAADPAVGGVLLTGHKGSAKTTLARGLATLLPGEAPFVELPVGATEDRLAGTLDLAAVLTSGARRFEPGLLAAAHGGVLYVDEVNLLPDHLVDVLLDVAASGVNRVEREGISHTHPSRFVLLGSMNPEEGELRPQLLDRFGLAVEVRSPVEPALRAAAVRRRLAFDRDPAGFASEWAAADDELRRQLSTVATAAVPEPLLDAISGLCAAAGAEGLRADLVICRAAAALAGLEGRTEAGAADVRRVAPMALAHRRRRSPLEEPGMAAGELERALDEALGDPQGEAPERTAEVDEPTRVVALRAERSATTAVPSAGRRSPVEGPRGRLVADRAPSGPSGPTSLAVGATVRAAAIRRATAAKETGHAAAAPLEASDLREAVRVQRAGNLVVLAVDASGSMGAARRMEAAKGAVLSLLLDAYQRRDRVALVTFRDDTADVVLRPTGSVEVARARLAELRTGGRTPLAAGIEAAMGVAEAGGRQGSLQPLLVLVTDGRHTAGPDPDEAAATVRRRGMAAVVVDAEDGPTRLGLARRLAEVMGARYLTLDQLSAGALRTEVR